MNAPLSARARAYRMGLLSFEDFVWSLRDETAPMGRLLAHVGIEDFATICKHLYSGGIMGSGCLHLHTVSPANDLSLPRYGVRLSSDSSKGDMQ